jgi:hypothetical protein
VKFANLKRKLPAMQCISDELCMPIGTAMAMFCQFLGVPKPLIHGTTVAQ